MTAEVELQATRRSGWLDVAEKGSIAGIKFFVWAVLFLGRPLSHFMLSFVVLYFVLFHRNARNASKAYLARVGRPNRFVDVFRHVFRFGQCVMDRALFVRGKTSSFTVDRHGEEHLQRLHAEKRGAILLSAHLGSFEAMRAYAQDKDFQLNIIVNSTNAKMMNQVLKGLDPDGNVNVLDVNEGLHFIFKVRDALERGEIVGMMGDRVGPDGKQTMVPFFGEDAPLPTGAYQLAATVGCPVYLAFGLYRGGGRYSFFCEPFADEVIVPRKQRHEALRGYAARYAERLEHYCREQPDNWFNFFDFWKV